MEHKRGDTFDYVAILPDTVADGDFQGWVPTCQIRDGRDKIVANVETAWIDPVTTRSISLHVSDTQHWKPGSVVFDIQFRRESDGYTRSTTTAPFNVVEDVTRP